MSADVWSTCMYVYVHHMHPWCLQTPKEKIGCPGTRIIDDCKLPCKCWALNLGLLEQYLVLFH